MIQIGRVQQQAPRAVSPQIGSVQQQAPRAVSRRIGSVQQQAPRAVSPAGFAVMAKISRRQAAPQRGPSETAQFIGVSDGMATFSTSTGGRVSMPVRNVITNQAWTGTFSIVRPKYGYPSAFKEV